MKESKSLTQFTGQNEKISRRQFLQRSAALAATTAFAHLPVAPLVHAQGSDRIRAGLIGCGGRGTGAAYDFARAAEGVEIYALGDLFPERVQACRQNLAGLGNKVNLADDRCFSGFDAYEKVIASGVDMVLLCAPPGFRPLHYEAAIQAGKHVFMEKPVAVCPAGVRKVIEVSELASQKKLGVMPGTQYRHHPAYIEVIKRLRDGQIGEVKAAFAYYIAGSPRGVEPRQPNWSDVEYQIRNWLFYNWLAGDQPVEQFVHNLDVMNWVMNANPVKAIGMGGRQVRTAPEYGDVYDHFAIEYEYPGGVKVTAMCRQMDHTTSRVSNTVIGTKGEALLEQFTNFYVKGTETWTPGTEWPNPYVLEHRDLITSIRAGNPINEGKRIAESTLTAIMGRMACYTGLEVTWEQAYHSKLNLMRDVRDFGPMPLDTVAMPGITKLE